MPNKPPVARPVGRPAIGRRVLIVLDEESLERARQLGQGNVSAGIRAALLRPRGKPQPP